MSGHGQDGSSRIGQLNGKWSVLFRIALATQPFLLGWGVWVTSQIFSAKSEQALLATKAEVSQLRTDILKSAISDELKGEIVLSRTKLDTIGERTTRLEARLDAAINILQELKGVHPR